MPLAAPTKQMTDLPPSSAQVKRATTEATCQEETSGGANKVIVLANYFLPVVAKERWVLYGLWANDGNLKRLEHPAREYTTSVFSSIPVITIKRLAEFWVKAMDDPTQVPSIADIKGHWVHEVNKHLNDINSLDTSCYTKAGEETTTTKKTKRSFVKGLLKGGSSKISSSNKNTINKGTTSKPVITKAVTTYRDAASSQVVKAGTDSSQAKSVHTSSASASTSASACVYEPSSSSSSGSKLVARGKKPKGTVSCSSSTASNQDTDPIYVESLKEYLIAILSFFPSANKPTHNVYEIPKKANITLGKWYPKYKIKEAFMSEYGFETASLVCRKHPNSRNTLLREIDLFLSIIGRIGAKDKGVSPIQIPNTYEPPNNVVCIDDCVCYPTLVKKGSKTVEACADLDARCSGKLYPTTVL